MESIIQPEVQGNTDIKKIILQETPVKKEKTEKNKKIEPKPKQKRVITNHSSWNFTNDDLTNEKQWNLLNEVFFSETESDSLSNSNSNTQNKITRTHRWIISQIRSKICGYLGQDIEKREREKNRIIDPADAIQIDLSNILQKLVDSKLDCFYCREKVAILYETVREPKQWTLERIDNKQGHHLSNVEIACLQCNLRRRTMYHERYVFTKQMSIQKIG
jgi:hypothetical protein